jgi:hypothetical protein
LPSRLNKAVPAELETIILKAITKKRTLRHGPGTGRDSWKTNRSEPSGPRYSSVRPSGRADARRFACRGLDKAGAHALLFFHVCRLENCRRSCCSYPRFLDYHRLSQTAVGPELSGLPHREGSGTLAGGFARYAAQLGPSRQAQARASPHQPLPAVPAGGPRRCFATIDARRSKIALAGQHQPHPTGFRCHGFGGEYPDAYSRIERSRSAFCGS